MVRGHRIAEERENARSFHVLEFRKLGREVGEKRWFLDVRRRFAPLVEFAAGNRNVVPRSIAVPDVSVHFVEHARVDRLVQELADFLLARPDVLEIDRLSLDVLSEWLGGEVEVHRSRKRIRDDEWRRREVVGAHVRVNPAFEVTVPREHRGRNELSLGNGFRDRDRKWAAVTDARCASITDQMESEISE